MALSINLDGNNSSQKIRNNEPLQIKVDRSSLSKDRDKRSLPPKSGRSKKKKILYLFLILLLGCSTVGLVFYKKLQSVAEEIGINIKTTDLIQSVISNEEPELKKDSSGKRTNVLLVGIDTREYGGGLRNTDTIIVASYSHETNETVMISIPRDNYVEIPGEGWFVKINGIYNLAEEKKEGSGMESLKIVVEDFTGLEIQYYGMVDIKAFKEVIDTVGGVDINVERSFTDYLYPAENDLDYDPVSFVEGPQTMDGETALKFARSRQSQGPEGSDFARARRQQKVIEAVKVKVLSTETLLNPNKVLDIMNSLQDHIRVSDIDIKDIEAGIALLRKQGETNKTYTFVMDPSIGDYTILETGVIPDAYSIGPVLGLGKYDDLHAYIEKVLIDPELYQANPTIYVYDTGLGFDESLAVAEELVEDYPFITIIFQGTLFYDKSGTIVYDNSSDKGFTSIVNRLSTSINANSDAKPAFISTSLNNEDIVILLGAPEVSTVDQNTPNQ